MFAIVGRYGCEFLWMLGSRFCACESVCSCTQDRCVRGLVSSSAFVAFVFGVIEVHHLCGLLHSCDNVRDCAI